MGDRYVSPNGAGDKSGSSWANAAPITSLDSMVKKAGAGGQVLLAADKGAYSVSGPIDISGGGAKGAPVTIKGVSSATGAAMDAVINGTRPATYAAGAPSGNELFKLQAGSGDLAFQHLEINNTGTAFRAAADVARVAIEHVDANNVMRFFEDYAGGQNKTATVSGLTIRDVEVDGFSKGVVRLQYDTHDVLIEDVRGDSGGQDGDDFAIGVHLDGSAHDVVIRRTVMENATQDAGDGYWNGDGFATEGSVHGVLFEDTASRGNTDAGYDLKSTDTTLVRALAEDNKRNYRVWTEATLIDSVGLDPHKRGGSGAQEQVWTAEGAKVKIVGGAFADSGSATIAFDNSGAIEMTGTAVAVASGGKWLQGKAIAGLAAADVARVAATGGFSVGTDLGSPAPDAGTGPVVNPPLPPVGPAAGGWTTFAAKPGSKMSGTGGADKFVFDASQKLGTTAISGFGKEDVLVTTQALKDGNGDGIVSFAKTPLVLGSDATLAIAGVSSLKLLGHTAEGYVYARQDGAVTLASVAAGGGKAAPTAAPGWRTVAATAKSETMAATAGRDKFVFDQAVKTGADTVKGFGREDVLVAKKALPDGDRDGLVALAKDGTLDLGSGGGTVKMAGVGAGLRLVGHTAEGYVYGAADVRPAGALEGKLGSADALKGDAGDKKANAFFFDTALGMDMGHDTVAGFGAKDVLVTTSALADVAAGRGVSAGAGGFSFAGGGGVAVTDAAGHAVTTLEFDGDQVIGGVHYYAYSLAGSAAGLGALAG